MSNVKIDSVVGFLSKIMELGAVSNDCERFYRGHASHKWPLVPGIYRKKEGSTTEENYHKDEHQMFRDIVAHHSAEFSQCSSAIEYLVKMQHYGLLTRLLDITTNPLIALYFACADERYKDKDGEVIVFDVPSNSIKHYDSDTISVLANLSKSKEFRLPLYSIQPQIDGNTTSEVKFHENLELGSTVLQHYNNLYKSFNEGDATRQILSSQSLTQLRDAFYRVDENKYSEKDQNFGAYITAFNKHGHIKLLLHQIKFEKSHFEAKIHPYDLPRVWASHVKLDNQRIINQSGAFFIFGVGCIQNLETKELCYVKDEAPKIPKDWIKTSDNRILIDRNKKDDILSELESIGISKSFVFPEIQTYADELKRKYGIVPQEGNCSSSGSQQSENPTPEEENSETEQMN